MDPLFNSCAWFLIQISIHKKANDIGKKSSNKNVPQKNDILLGRGGNNNKHPGNEQLRSLARVLASQYSRCSKKCKSDLSRSLVKQVRDLDPPGRFLKVTLHQDGSGPEWDDVGDRVAREKASQVLRDAVGMLEDRNPVILRKTSAKRTKRSKVPLGHCVSSARIHRPPADTAHNGVSNYDPAQIRMTKADANVSRYQHACKKRRSDNIPLQSQVGLIHRSPRVRVPQMHEHMYTHNYVVHPASRHNFSNHPTIPSVSPEISEYWREGRPDHNNPWASVNVSFTQGAPHQHWNGHSYQPQDCVSYAHGALQAGFQTTKIAHNDVCDDWNLDLDPDDLSWASESKQNCGNPS